jgi:hypothetical protein
MNLEVWSSMGTLKKFIIEHEKVNGGPNEGQNQCWVSNKNIFRYHLGIKI